MNAHLEEILRTSIVHTADGDSKPLLAATSRDQCLFLQRIVHEIGAQRCLEVGLAYGVSALAVAEVSGEPITTIDLYETSLSERIGLLNLERAGFAYRHFDEASQDVLPRLLAGGEKFDFAYVDTTKVFDSVLVDAYYITRLLRVGGVIAFDDCNWPGVRKVVRYLSKWPHLKVYAAFGDNPSSWQRRAAARIAALSPGFRRLLRSELIETDEALGIAGGCVAFQKTAEDARPWNWSIAP